MIRWERMTAEDSQLVLACAERAHATNKDINMMDLSMDISAAHLANPLKLQDMLDADDFNFNHDVYGIHRHIDRKTGEMNDHFLPRFLV